MNKYRNKRTTCRQGHSHQSKAEATRCNELALMLEFGHINSYESQPSRIALTPGGNITYRPDFVVTDNMSRTWYEDVKSPATDKARDWRRTIKLWEEFVIQPLHIRYMRKSGLGTELTRIICGEGETGT